MAGGRQHGCRNPPAQNNERDRYQDEGPVASVERGALFLVILCFVWLMRGECVDFLHVCLAVVAARRGFLDVDLLLLAFEGGGLVCDVSHACLPACLPGVRGVGRSKSTGRVRAPRQGFIYTPAYRDQAPHGARQLHVHVLLPIVRSVAIADAVQTAIQSGYNQMEVARQPVMSPITAESAGDGEC